MHWSAICHVMVDLDRLPAKLSPGKRRTVVCHLRGWIKSKKQKKM
jgi:hypothetical protein